MSLQLNTNITAFKASNRAQMHHANLARSVHRLTTGKWLNSSQDSPTDMAVHNVHNGRLATLAAGKQNIHDAITMVQTAESGMMHISNLLIKMKETAIAAATGTLNQDQREIIASEFHQLALEIDRIAYHTEFKGIKLLEGTHSARTDIDRLGNFVHTNEPRITEAPTEKDRIGLRIHFGPYNNRAEDYYFIRTSDLTMPALFAGTPGPSIYTQHDAQETVEMINTALRRKDEARYYTGIMQNRLEASLGYKEDNILLLQGINSILADTELADEMTRFATQNIMLDAATAMLAQANVIPRIALKLLNF